MIPIHIFESQTESQRVESIDVLRGFALLGILIMNIQAFAMPGPAYINPSAYGDLTGANFWIWMLSHVFVDQKMIVIFSMLFGAGIVLMWQRAETRGENSVRLHYRRMGWLILFGLVHAHGIWSGDILVWYGMWGLAAFLFRRKTPRTLLIVALLFGLIETMLMAGIASSMPGWPPEQLEELRRDMWQPPSETIDQKLKDYRGSWIDQSQRRSPDALFFETAVFILMGWKVGSSMLLGMALFKLGGFDARWSRKTYKRLVAAGAFAGIPVVAYGASQIAGSNWEMRYSLFPGSQYNYWASYLAALGWIGAVMLWCQSSRALALKNRLAAVGRTAFSNYILQSLICTTIFYGHGFGYFGMVRRTGQLAVVFAVWIVHLAISPLWLRHFHFGPLEWAWRRLSYGKPQPFRISTARNSPSAACRMTRRKRIG